jgi:hypothetical protein
MLKNIVNKRSTATIAGILALASTSLVAQTPTTPTGPDCSEVPNNADLKKALVNAQAQKNGGLGFHMWATVVNRDGFVCAVAFSGASRGDQWPGSRVISAQKANTANAFSLPSFALSTANRLSFDSCIFFAASKSSFELPAFLAARRLSFVAFRTAIRLSFNKACCFLTIARLSLTKDFLAVFRLSFK